MTDYDIRYEILDYDKLHNRLLEIMLDERFAKHENIGYSGCGFPIEHYSVGNGPMHVVYMGACHGNEIITVDYITQLMLNISKGNIEFDTDTFTIDFIPVQNPEGFYVTTYALKQAMEGMDDEDIEVFCYGYYKAYSLDDRNAMEEEAQAAKTLSNDAQSADASKKTKAHNDYLKVNTDCIPLRDEAHKLLNKKIKAMYADSEFPLGTLGNFFANADGVNLNDNNEYYYRIIKDRFDKGIVTYGNRRDNNLSKSKPGPIGCVVADLHKPFEYAPENAALLDYLEKNPNYLFMNCHGTGGVIFVYPFGDEHKFISDYTYFINNRIASAYCDATARAYREKGEDKSYSIVGHPESITGLGDVMRRMYKASLLLELSKMGGNPIGPYGDREGNYEITMVANFEGFMASLNAVKELEPWYGR